MLTIRYQTAFKKDYKRIVRRGYDVRLLEEVITILAEQKPLQKAIGIITCPVTILDAGSAI